MDQVKGLSVVFALRFLSFSGYGDLVCEYGKRVLSYPEDSLFAFAGITTALSRVFQGGFLSGLPLMFLDIALLWEPSGISKRRASLLDSQISPCLPSWSWVGWEGEISIHNWNAGMNYIKRSSNRLVEGSMTWHRIASILQWSVSEELQSNREQIIGSWQQYMQCHWDDYRAIPPGWIRHRYTHAVKTINDCLPPSGYDKASALNYFTHQSCPDAQFWFPIPFNSEDRQLSICPIARYFHCKTQRTWFWTGRIYKPEMDFINHTSLLVNEQNGNWAGIVHLHIDKPGSFATESTTKMELIALSEGSVIPDEDSVVDFEELEIDEKLKSEGIYNFYNVMCIEWDNGIAYRKAIGRVPKTTWEQQELEWIDVTLG
jgi:hypothetical protein